MAEQAKAEHVRVTVASTAALQEASGHYDRLVYGEQAPLALLEIVLKPGVYESSPSLSMAATQPLGRNVNILIRGEDPARPPVLKDLQVRLSGDTVRMENLVFRGWSHVSPMLQVWVGSAFEMQGCAFVENLRAGKEGGSLVSVTASYETGPKTALIKDTWFVRNGQSQPTTLVAFATQHPDMFSAIDFDHVAFVDNSVACGVSPAFTDALRLRDSFVYGSVFAEPTSRFAWAMAPRTRVSFEQSLIVTTRADQLIGYGVTNELPRERFQPLSISGGTVYLREGGGLPGIQVNQARIVDGGGKRVVGKKEIDAIVAQALKGVRPDLAALKRQLGLE